MAATNRPGRRRNSRIANLMRSLPIVVASNGSMRATRRNDATVPMRARTRNSAAHTITVVGAKRSVSPPMPAPGEGPGECRADGHTDAGDHEHLDDQCAWRARRSGRRWPAAGPASGTSAG